MVRLIDGYNYNTYYWRLKIPLFNAYGGGCTWEDCDIDLECMLQLDHVLKNGAAHRKALGYLHGGTEEVWKDLKKRGYPPGHRVLCANHHASVTWTNPILPLKTEGHDHYGWICLCCGHNIARELQFDHINDDGAAHKAQIVGHGAQCFRDDDGLYTTKSSPGGIVILQDLKNRGWPQGIVQVLCANCNQAKRRFKSLCPSWVHSGEKKCTTESKCTMIQMRLPM